MDAYYRTNPPLIVVKDQDAICTRRPLKYVEHEDAEIRRRQRGSMAGSVMEVAGTTPKV